MQSPASGSNDRAMKRRHNQTDEGGSSSSEPIVKLGKIYISIQALVDSWRGKWVGMPSEIAGRQGRSLARIKEYLSNGTSGHLIVQPFDRPWTLKLMRIDREAGWRLHNSFMNDRDQLGLPGQITHLESDQAAWDHLTLVTIQHDDYVYANLNNHVAPRGWVMRLWRSDWLLLPCFRLPLFPSVSFCLFLAHG